MSHGDAMHFPLTIPLQPSKLVIASILAAHAAAGWTLFHVPSLALLQPGVLWSPLRGVSLLLWCGVFGSLLLALRQEHAKAGKALVVHADGMLTCVCADEVLDYRVGAGAVDFGWALWLPLVALVDGQQGARVRQRVMLARTNTSPDQWRALRIWLRHKSALLRSD